MRAPDRDAAIRRRLGLDINPNAKLDTRQIVDRREATGSDIARLLYSHPLFEHPGEQQTPTGLEDYKTLNPATKNDVRQAYKRNTRPTRR